MRKFKGKYRIASTRLSSWDYSSPGHYFVTICTQNLQPFFGEVVDEVVRLSRPGEIIFEEWQNTEELRSNITLDEWVIMPNHIHGIIIINESDVETPRRGVSTETDEKRGNPKWKANSLGSIIGQFRGICTKRIRGEGYIDFAWQPRFYDHIIRNEKSLQQIREYIRNNPLQWELDRENPLNIHKRIHYDT